MDVVSTDWLEDHLDDPDLRVVDATVDVDVTTGEVVSGRARWEASHIPGSCFADLLVDLSDPDGSFPFTVPSPERFASAVAAMGIGDDSRVVAYDARENMWAARFWWQFRVFGFEACSVLDGGWTAWVAEGRPVSSEPSPEQMTATFTPHPRPDLVATKDDVRQALRDPHICLVDALSRREYSGELAFYGRAGHIPGAINVPARRIIDRDTQRYRLPAELRGIFGPAVEAQHVITYCGGGVAAASDAFALHLLGHRNVAVYDGSMIEWCADPTLPLETGVT